MVCEGREKIEDSPDFLPRNSSSSVSSLVLQLLTFSFFPSICHITSSHPVSFTHETRVITRITQKEGMFSRRRDQFEEGKRMKLSLSKSEFSDSRSSKFPIDFRVGGYLMIEPFEQRSNVCFHQPSLLLRVNHHQLVHPYTSHLFLFTLSSSVNRIQQL